MMKSTDDYQRAIAAVRTVIHKWDPYSLIAGACPRDEFDSEIANIITQIPRIKGTNDATHAISRVFSSAFEPGRFRPDNCIEVGRNLYEVLLREGLLDESC